MEHFVYDLLDWFAVAKRDLPWRRHVSPYTVWISEIMLQQTQTERVISYYRNWFDNFPDIFSVHKATEDALLKCWEGLGYYSRPKNIKKTADILASQNNGLFPEDYQQLMQLPGIGPYTASAILSLAFEKPFPVIDANVERVVSRLCNISEVIKTSQAQKKIRTVLLTLLPKDKSRAFNQAMMELGALVCKPQRPDCSKCPGQSCCQGYHQGEVHNRPVKRKKKQSIPLEVSAGVLFAQQEVFIQKRPPHGLMPNLWEFPGGKLKKGETPEAALVREFWEELHFEISILDKMTVIRHSYTSFRVTLHIFRCQLLYEPQQPCLKAAVESRWVLPEQLQDFAFPAADLKVIELLKKDPFTILRRP